jgi:hypothetical protein
VSLPRSPVIVKGVQRDFLISWRFFLEDSIVLSNGSRIPLQARKKGDGADVHPKQFPQYAGTLTERYQYLARDGNFVVLDK